MASVQPYTGGLRIYASKLELPVSGLRLDKV